MEDARRTIVGRDVELSTIREFLAAVPNEPSVLVLEGEPGIGKTVLWDAGVFEAQRGGHRVLSCRAAQAEAKLSYTALSDLLAEAADEVLPSLPSPQRRALEVALLRVEPEGPMLDHRAAAVGLLSALAVLSSSRPVVLAVDDMQWLDAASARALAFVLRRLREERVGLLASLRTQPGSGSDLERMLPGGRLRRLSLGPLSLAALHHILEEKLGTAFPRSTLVAISEASAGNPFFAIELGRALLAAGGPVAPGLLPVPRQLEELLDQNLRRLPASSRHVLLAAAAMAEPRTHAVGVASRVPDPAAALSRAEDAGVIVLEGDRIRFSHPLLASTIYSLSTPSRRRAVHRRLAEILEDAEERALHLARATVQPDEAVAATIEAAARRAYRRGAPDVAAELAEDAVRLTPSDRQEDLRRRRLEAAEDHRLAGNAPSAKRLLQGVVEAIPPGPERADVLVRLAAVSGGIEAGLRICRRALEEAEGDPGALAAAHRAAGYFASLAGDYRAGLEHAEEAARAAEVIGDPELLSPALGRLGHQRFLSGRGVQVDLFERAISMETPELRDQPNVSASTMYALTLMNVDDLQGARERLLAMLREHRERGAIASAGQALFYLAQLEGWAGNWRTAIEHATERLELEPHENPGAPLYARAFAKACLGLVDEARSDAEEGFRLSEEDGNTVIAMQNLHVLGFTELSLEHLAEACEHLRRATEILRAMSLGEFGPYHCAADAIEALVGLGRLDEATELLDWAEGVGETTGRAWTLATALRCRALAQAAAGDIDGSLTTADLALEHHERLPMPFERGRTLLVKGTIERRRRQRRAARETLQQALVVFETLDAPLWAERARREIARIGDRSEAHPGLTPVEERVARLAATGQTNREIASALFLSVKTVEDNLSRVYRKLGIHSRAQLGTLLARSPGRSA
jgi:DNA-binding CsgD family transcriptional regulator